MDLTAAALERSALAWIFDSVDGRVARATGTESAFGREFDSLADVVSFGIAPAFLAYAWGVRAMAAANSPEALHLLQLGWVIGCFYLCCRAWRLARFNIQGMALGSNRFFVGLPIAGQRRARLRRPCTFSGIPHHPIRAIFAAVAAVGWCAAAR